MTRPTLYVAITNHGFGHATRATAVAATVKALCPEVHVILATTAPEWLLASYFEGAFTRRERAFDVGVRQADSLTMDKAATLAAWEQIQRQADTLVAEEAEYLRAAEVDLVLADIPPLASAIAQAADIPCWMSSNFGWDFIYRPWGGDFTALANWIADRFSRCDRLLRLPFHEPMGAFPTIIDVGLTGGTPRYSAEELRSRWQIDAPKTKTVLLTFGGLGLARVPYGSLADFPDWQFITFDRDAPALPNLLRITDRRYRPVDAMPLCDRVISKPGYSTFSEACRLDVPIVTLPRNDFAEGPLLLQGIQAHSNHQILDPDAFFGGDWRFLRQDPEPPQSTTRLDKNGNQAIADAIVAQLTGTANADQPHPNQTHSDKASRPA